MYLEVMWNESFKEVSFIIYCAIFNYSSYYNDVLSITIHYVLGEYLQQKLIYKE